MDGSIIIKVSFQEDIRRFGMKLADLSLESLQDKIQTIFSIQEEWALKWKDEDGDFVTITQDYELMDAKDHQGNKSVLRLWVILKKSQKKKSPSQQQQQAKAVAGAMVETLHGVISEISSAFKKPPTTTTTNPASSSSSTSASTAPNSSTSTSTPIIPTNANTTNVSNNNNNNRSKCSQEHSKSSHLARCDVTKKLLWLNGPKWYHKPGTAQDLCEEQWLMLSEDDKAMYIEVKSIEDLGDEKNIYATSRSRCCPYQSGQIQIKTSPYQFGALCDVTDVQLFPGCGWYHLKGSNYDICETIFNQLPSEQQALYLKVEKFDDLDSDEYCIVSPNQPKNENNEELEKKNTVKQEQEQGQEHENEKENDEDEDEDEDDKLSLQNFTFDQTTNIYPNLCSVSESSIPYGYVIRVGDKISPTWTIKNTGSGKWNDVKLRACSPNLFQLMHDIVVPSLSPEESATISVELTVPPQTETPKSLFAEFELIDSQEIPFGSRLNLKVNVQPEQLVFSDINQPPVANEANLLVQLQNAGFTDVRACIIAIRENQGDLNAAALALLRSDQ